MSDIKLMLNKTANDMKELLVKKIIPFWLDRSVDDQYGGFMTFIDQNGKVDAGRNKMIVTQTRMLWGFSALSCYAPDEHADRIEKAARQGYEFLIDYFWDRDEGGFIWETSRNGTPVDKGKLTYAQCFAIYSLCAYYAHSGDKKALEYAEKTFDLLQIFAADTHCGGYLENLECDWSPAAGGIYAGDRKSLDIHLHVMEAFTVLYRATQKEIHRRKLIEIIDVILTHMVNIESGYGYNQFNLCFESLPAINIHRTWNADRVSGESVDKPTDTTSYGHNVELSWLLQRAYDVLGQNTSETENIMAKLLDNSLAYGYDYEYGGVYRDGIGNNPALIKDKEWWQNYESMIGYLNGYARYGERKYLEAFNHTWDFIKKYFIIDKFGESMQLLSRTGIPIISDIGNAWKGIYHTGRALAECVSMIETI